MGGINHYQYAPNPVNWVDPFGLSCKETKAIEVPAYDHNDPMADAITPVAIVPVEWFVEGLADAAEAITQMVDTGVTAAGVATAGIALIPGKVADRALEPVVKKLDDVIKLDPGNKGAWKSMENKWAKALKEEPPKKVEVDIQAVYDGESKRPSKFVVRYDIDGKPSKRIFKNKSGG